VLSSGIFFFHLESKDKLEIAWDGQEARSSGIFFFHLESAQWCEAAIKWNYFFPLTRPSLDADEV